MTDTTAQAVQNQGKHGAMPILTDVIMIVLISVLVSLALLTFAGPMFGQQQAASKIAYVNFQQLMNEYVMQLGDDVVAGTVQAADMPAKSGQFTQELLKRLQAHANEGTTVLRSDSVVAAPDAVLDITDGLRADLISSGFLRKPAGQPQAPASR